MKKSLLILALVVALAAVGTWFATGANRGWTKTSVEKKTLDEVTGLEAITYEKQFVPGLDFLGAALLGSSALVGLSFLFRNQTSQQPNR